MKWLVFVVLCACGGGESPAGGADGSPGDGSPGDGSVGSDGSTTPDTTNPDTRLYPLEVGYSWIYSVTSTYPSCPGGQREQKVLGMATKDGRQTFEVKSFCGGASGFSHAAGDRVESYYDWGPVGWYRMTDEPVADGHTWTTTNGSATFTQTYDDVGTHAGHTGCWKVTQNVSYTSYWIYCRGTGLVSYEMIDLAGGTIRAELVSKSF